MSVVEELRTIETFSDLSDEQLAWIASRSRFVDFEPGEVMFEEGAPADTMIGVIRGEVNARREKGPPDGRLFSVRAGELGAMLPFSRLKTFPVTARAVVPTRLTLFPAALFTELFQQIPELEPRFVSALADRVRRTTRDESHRDTLAALGKLAAGLAHELNNPAAAVARSAAELTRRLAQLRQLSADVAALGIPVGALQPLAGLAARNPSPIFLNALERGELEDEIGGWLDGQGVDNAWELASSFVDAGITVPQLESAIGDLSLAAAGKVLAWAEASLACDALLADIAAAASRITSLVGAVKSYSHMDQAPDKVMTDVVAGLESTLAVVREISRDLPAVPAYAGELNQVWTNLIDNAVDALPAGGRITLRATRETDRILVEVADNGPGIPLDLQNRIWEPFFTTKDVGQGSGLGLDIVQRIIVHRHNGQVLVESIPGDTRFRVWIPAGDR
jgi:signal transduction histidine kinase